jgi:hypothetical protein
LPIFFAFECQISIDFQPRRATTRVAPTERFVGATLVVAHFEKNDMKINTVINDFCMKPKNKYCQFLLRPIISQLKPDRFGKPVRFLPLNIFNNLEINEK